MSLYNIIAFACKRGTPGSRLACPKAGFGAAGHKPGRNPVAGREAPLRRGEAWEQGWAEGWGSVCRSPKTRHLHYLLSARLCDAPLSYHCVRKFERYLLYAAAIVVSLCTNHLGL